MKELARPTEVSSFDSLKNSAQREIDTNGPNFENMLDQLWSKGSAILIRQDWFIVDRFKWQAENPQQFVDVHKHAELVALGKGAMQADDMEKLRGIMALLDAMRIDTGSPEDLLSETNIIGVANAR